MVDDLLAHVFYIIDNSYVEFNDIIYRQIIGIPMGTSCAPILANIFLHHNELQFIAQKIEIEEWDTLTNLNALYRYQDDLTTIPLGILFQFQLYLDLCLKG